VLAEQRAHGHHLTLSQARVFQRIGPDGSRPGELNSASGEGDSHRDLGIPSA